MATPVPLVTVLGFIFFHFWDLIFWSFYIYLVEASTLAHLSADPIRGQLSLIRSGGFGRDFALPEQYKAKKWHLRQTVTDHHSKCVYNGALWQTQHLYFISSYIWVSSRPSLHITEQLENGLFYMLATNNSVGHIVNPQTFSLINSFLLTFSFMHLYNSLKHFQKCFILLHVNIFDILVLISPKLCMYTLANWYKSKNVVVDLVRSLGLSLRN